MLTKLRGRISEQMRFLVAFKHTAFSYSLKMWRETAPCSLAGVTDTAFAKLCSCWLLDVFSHASGPQAPTEADCTLSLPSNTLPYLRISICQPDTTCETTGTGLVHPSYGVLTARLLASQAEAIVRTGKTWPHDTKWRKATKRRN